MLSNKDPSHSKRIRQVSYKLNIPEEVVELALHYTSEYIKNKIASVEFNKDIMMSEDEFNSKFPIIKIPALGYLKPNYYVYKHVFAKSQIKKQKINK